VRFEDSDHHRLAAGRTHEILYHKGPQQTGGSW
jgi:hypothetical protein